MVKVHFSAPAQTSARRNPPRGYAADPELDANNPFPGPKPYREDQKELFFGRGSETDELTSLVLSTSAVLLYAQSGSGKSSLLQAGLVPSLEDLGYRILPTVRFGRISLKPSDDEVDASQRNPFVKLVCDTLLPEDALPPDRRDLGELAAYLRGQDVERPTLLILDQLEELFAHQALWRERGTFLTQLRRALDANPWLHAVLAIRSDYLANLLPHEQDLPGRLLIRCRLESLREQAARDAVEMAFSKTGVPLTSAELDLLLDRLMNLDVGVPGSPVRGQYVNLIQLQIFCRRLWREKAEAGPPHDAGASDDSQVLQESDVNLADYMQSFVDDAVASVVAQTRCDGGIVRRWLEDRLTTPTGRRAVLLVDNEQTAGLPDDVLDSLENARLIQIEQRNQSQWAELTHDSMVAAIHASNTKWGKTRRRSRLLRTAVLVLALSMLLALFPFLLIPTDRGTLLTNATGSFTGTLSIPFPPVSQGHVAVVEVSLLGSPGYPRGEVTVWVAAKGQGKRKPDVLASNSFAAVQDDRADATVNFAINTVKSTSYALIMRADTSDQEPLRYNVTVHSAPVVLDLREPGVSGDRVVNSSLVAVKLYPHQPSYLTFGGLDLRRVLGVRVLMTDSTQQDYVVESPSGGYAVLSGDTSSGGALGGDVGEEVPNRGPDLPLGAHANIRADYASIDSINVEQAGVPFGVETSCKSDYAATAILLDSNAAAVGSTARSVPEGSVLVPAGHDGEYRLILLADPAGSGIDCRVSVRSFAQQAITTIGNHTIAIDPNTSFAAYPIRLPADTIIIVTNLNGTPASLDCLSKHITESDSQRLLAFVPANHDCVLSIGQPPHPSRLAHKPASFALKTYPVASGRG